MVAVSSLIAVAGLVSVVIAVPPTYRASSSVVLLNPPSVPEVESEGASEETLRALDNPYERFNDLSVVVDIMRRILVSAPTEEVLAERGLAGDYSVAANIDFYRGPIVDIAAEGASEAEAITGARLVVDMLEETLDAVQERQGTDPNYRITSDVVVPATRATRVLSSTLRRAIAVSALGALFVVGSAVAADALTTRRSSPATRRSTGVVRNLAKSSPAPRDVAHSG